MVIHVEVVALLCMLGFICGCFVFASSLGCFIRKGVTIMREPYVNKEHDKKSMHHFFLLGFLFLGISFGLSFLFKAPTTFSLGVLDEFQRIDVSAKGEMIGILFFSLLLRWLLKNMRLIWLKIASVHLYNQVVEKDSSYQMHEPLHATKTLERHLHLLKERYDK